VSASPLASVAVTAIAANGVANIVGLVGGGRYGNYWSERPGEGGGGAISAIGGSDGHRVGARGCIAIANRAAYLPGGWIDRQPGRQARRCIS